MRSIITPLLVLLTAPLFAQMPISGVVKDFSGNPVANVSVFTEWTQGRQVKRSFTQTLGDGSFHLTASKLPCKLRVEGSGF